MIELEKLLADVNSLAACKELMKKPSEGINDLFS